MLWALVDLEKAYGMVDRHVISQMLIVYTVVEKLSKAVQSFYVYSRASIRLGMDVSEWFPVNVRMRQFCLIARRLFNHFNNI